MTSGQEMIVVDGSSVTPYSAFPTTTTPIASVVPTTTISQFADNPSATFGSAFQQYYPYLVPFPADPTPAVAPPQIGLGQSDFEEMQKNIDDTKKSNKSLVFAIIILVILLLGGIAAIVALVVTNTTLTTSTTTTATTTTTTTTTTVSPSVVSTTIGFQATQPAMTYGADMADSTSLAFIATQINFCSKVQAWFTGTDASTACKVTSLSQGVIATMELVFSNSGRTSAQVLTSIQTTGVTASTAETLINAIAEAAFTIVSTSTT